MRPDYNSTICRALPCAGWISPVIRVGEVPGSNPGAPISEKARSRGAFQRARRGSVPVRYTRDLLRVAKELGLPVPRDVVVIAVEAAECSTVGGRMTRAVEAAIPRAVDLVGQFLHVT